MQNKRAFVVVIAAGVMGAGLALSFWHVYGFLCGESFFRGRPSSFYATRLKREIPKIEQVGAVGGYSPSSELIMRVFGIGFGEDNTALVPVLSDLSNHTNPKIRLWALVTLDSIRTDDNIEKRPFFEKAIQDTDEQVRLQAAGYLWEVNRNADEVLPIIMRTLRDDASPNKLRALFLLIGMESKGKSAISLVEKIADNDSDEVLREVAMKALAAIKE